MTRRSWLALAGAAAAACVWQRPEPGTRVYYRTVPLDEGEFSALEEALGAQLFPLAHYSGAGGGGRTVWRGSVALRRGADGPEEVERVVGWLRAHPMVTAASADSAAVR